MQYLKGAPQQIFKPLVADILDEKPKDIHTWMINWMRKNKVKLKKALINIPREEEADSDTEDEDEKNERLRLKAQRMGTHEIIEEDEYSEAESFGQGEPDPEPNF